MYVRPKLTFVSFLCFFLHLPLTRFGFLEKVVYFMSRFYGYFTFAQCTMRSLYSISISQPNKLGPILKVAQCDII